MDFSTYPLDEVKRLAASGRILISRRPRYFITQRTGRLDVAAFMQELFEALTLDDFYKSDEPDVLSWVWGDVYRPIPFIEPETGEPDDWHLKFFVNNEDIMINVMSANYDGYIH
jgi:hypothetical protein